MSVCMLCVMVGITYIQPHQPCQSACCVLWWVLHTSNHINHVSCMLCVMVGITYIQPYQPCQSACCVLWWVLHTSNHINHVSLHVVCYGGYYIHPTISTMSVCMLCVMVGVTYSQPYQPCQSACCVLWWVLHTANHINPESLNTVYYEGYYIQPTTLGQDHELYLRSQLSSALQSNCLSIISFGHFRLAGVETITTSSKQVYTAEMRTLRS